MDDLIYLSDKIENSDVSEKLIFDFINMSNDYFYSNEI